MKHRWKLFVEPLDCATEWGLCVGKYTEDDKPIIRHAVRFPVNCPANRVAASLRAMADYVEQKMKD